LCIVEAFTYNNFKKIFGIIGSPMAKIETRTEPMVLNMGPHHPSMHGVLRLIVTLDGEDVIDCEPVIGYLHRGMEKIAENRTNVMYVWNSTASLTIYSG